MKMCKWFVLTAFLFSPLFALSKDVEKIKVVGSHIKRTNLEGPSPVLVIDREQIEMSGHNSVADVLRDLPTASLGGARENALSFPASATGTSLRGMSGSDILYLLNGRRITPYGGGNNVDLSFVPLSVIEKVEILKDGASAIYGSDAVGGVINIVTKKGDVGGQWDVQGSLVQRQEGSSPSSLASFLDFYNWNDEDNRLAGKGDKITVSASYGGTAGGINYLAGAQLRADTALYYRDREFGNLDAKEANKKHYSPIGSPGAWLEGGAWQVDPNCEKEGGSLLPQAGGGNLCGFNFAPYMQISPGILQASAFLQTDKDTGSNSSLSSTSVYSFTNTRSAYAPPPGYFKTFGEQDWRVPSPSGGLAETVRYRFVKEAGAGSRKGNLDVHTYQLGLNYETALASAIDLNLDLSLSGAHYLDLGTGYFDYKTLTEMVKAQTLNLWAPADKKNDISKAAIDIKRGVHSNMLAFEPNISGELAETKNTLWSFSLGALMAGQRYSEGGEAELKETETKIKNDENRIFGGAVQQDGTGGRVFGGLYGEVIADIGNFMELQLAARSDHYYYFKPKSQEESANNKKNIYFVTKQVLPFTDVEIPLSPRVALSVQPFSTMKIRASWGMGFKAPSLESMYQDSTYTHPNAIDHKMCQPGEDTTACTFTQRVAKLEAGSKYLKPENSENFNIGFLFEPVKNFSVNLDFYQTKQRNIIDPGTEAFINDALLLEKAKGAKEVKEKTGIDIQRDTSGNLLQVTVPSGNISRQKVQGVDLDFNFTVPVTSTWDLRFNVMHSHLLYVERLGMEGLDPATPVPYYNWLVDLLGLEKIEGREGTWTGAPRWRNKLTLNAVNKDKGYNLYAVLHYIPGQLEEWYRPSNEKLIDDHWEVDLAGEFALSKKSALTVGIKNLLGKQRPLNYTFFDTSGGYTNSSLYSMRGRTIDVKYTYNFK